MAAVSEEAPEARDQAYIYALTTFGHALDLAPDAMIIADTSGKVIFANLAAEHLFGYPVGELRGVDVDQLVPAELAAKHRRLREEYVEHPRRRLMGSGLWLEALRKDGVRLPVDISLSPAELDGKPVTIAVIRDISERVEVSRRMHESQARFRSAFHDAPTGMALVDLAVSGFPIRSSNPALSRILRSERVPNWALGQALMSLIHPMDRPSRESAGALDGERRLLRADDSWVWCSLRTAPIQAFDPSSRLCVCHVDDISGYKSLVEGLVRLGRHDALTGLPNRQQLADWITRVAALGAEGGPVAVLAVDLDSFKPVNDRFGHDVGDEVLSEQAKRMSSLIRTNDIAARVGGDEFVIAARGISEASAIELGQRLLESLRAPIESRAGPVSCPASIGIYCAASPEPEMIMHADAAIHRAKRRGGNQISQ